MDEMTRGGDEEAETAPTDRDYWLNRANTETVGVADEALKIINEFAPNLKLNYTKHYIGLVQQRTGQADNFVSFIPKKQNMHLQIKLKETEETTVKINNTTLDMLPYDKVYGGYYRLRLKKDTLCKYREILKELMEMSFKDYGRS